MLRRKIGTCTECGKGLHVMTDTPTVVLSHVCEPVVSDYQKFLAIGALAEETRKLSSMRHGLTSFVRGL